MRSVRPVLLMGALLVSSPLVFAQFAPRIEPPDVNFGQGRLSARQAKQHIGQEATVCGRVSRTQPPPRGVPSAPTYLNLGDPGVDGFFRADFVIAIQAADLTKFPPGQVEQYFGQIACARGTIEAMSVDHGNWQLPRMFVQSPTSIEILPNDPSSPLPGQHGVPSPSRCQPWEKEMADGSCVQWRQRYN